MYLFILQILVSFALITAIILQSKGTGLSRVFGGSSLYHAKRGIEKTLFTMTIVLSVAFVVLAFVNAL